MKNIIKCPTCGMDMTLKTENTSQDFRNNKKYNRFIYHCEKDDVWMNFEIPVEK